MDYIVERITAENGLYKRTEEGVGKLSYLGLSAPMLIELESGESFSTTNVEAYSPPEYKKSPSITVQTEDYVYSLKRKGVE